MSNGSTMDILINAVDFANIYVIINLSNRTCVRISNKGESQMYISLGVEDIVYIVINGIVYINTDYKK